MCSYGTNHWVVLRQAEYSGKWDKNKTKSRVFDFDFKGKVHPKTSWTEMKEPTKTRRTPLTVCKYLFYFSRHFILKFQISPHRRRHDSHFLNRNEAQMTSQLQYQSQVEVAFLYNSENHGHSGLKFSGMIVFLSSNQNK